MADDRSSNSPDRIVGEYILGRALGNSGSLFEARHRQTSAPCALKRLDLTEAAAERFLKEALYPAVAAAKSPHVMPVLSFFRDPQDQAFYLATDLVSTGGLADFLVRNKRLPSKDAVETGLGIARGLAAIHEQGIAHLEMEPGSILMDLKDGRWVPRIGGFGLSDPGAPRPAAGRFGAGYAAPEQIDGTARPGPSSDLFAFGMILYELLTGKPAAQAQNPTEYAAWLRTRQKPVPPGILRPELQPWKELDTLIDHLTEPDPALRMASAVEAVRILSRVLRDMESAPRQAAASAPPAPSAAAPSVREPSAAAPQTPRYRLFDTLSVGIATFLGSPIAGTILMAINYHRLGRGEDAFLSCLAGLAVTALAVAVGVMLPDGIAAAVGAGVLGGTAGAAAALQAPLVKEHRARGGRTGSRLGAAGLGLLLPLIVFGVWVAAPLTADIASGFFTRTVKIGSDFVNYSGGATEEEAKALGEYLKRGGYFVDRGVQVNLRKAGGEDAVEFVVTPAGWMEPANRQDLMTTALMAGRETLGFPIVVRLLDTEGVRRMERRIGRVQSGTDSLYYFDPTTPAEAEAVAARLQTLGYFVGSGVAVELTMSAGRPLLAFAVTDGAWKEADKVGVFATLAARASAFDHSFTLQFMDAGRVPKRQFLAGRVMVGNGNEVVYAIDQSVQLTNPNPIDPLDFHFHDQAGALGKALTDAGYFDEESSMVLWTREDSGSALSFLTRETALYDTSVIGSLTALARQVQASVGSFRRVRLVDSNLRVQKDLPIDYDPDNPPAPLFSPQFNPMNPIWGSVYPGVTPPLRSPTVGDLFNPYLGVARPQQPSGLGGSLPYTDPLDP